MDPIDMVLNAHYSFAEHGGSRVHMPCIEHTQPCHDAALLPHAAVCATLPSLLQLTGGFTYSASILPTA